VANKDAGFRRQRQDLLDGGRWEHDVGAPARTKVITPI
jgi:hypothetical protein